MKTLAALSLLLNILLGGFAIWLAGAEHRPAARMELSRLLTNRVLRSQASPAPAPAGPATAATPQVVEVAEAFHWSQLESADYRVYVANLHTLGCPEETVRDLIVADVDDLFSGRVKRLVDEVTGGFWRLVTQPDEMEKLVEAKYQELSALDDERDGLLKTLFAGRLPRDLEAEAEALAKRRANAEEIGDFLSAEKRARYLAAGEELEHAWAEFVQTPQLTGPQQQAKRKELEAARWATLAEALTPEELAELRLRESSAAGLRQQLVGLDLSEAEVRLAAQARLAKDAAKGKRGSAEADASQQALREALGPERLAAFERGVDSRFHSFHRVAQRLELPDATAIQAYEIRVQTEQAAQRVRKDKSLAVETRTELLQALETETKQALAASLGATGFSAYAETDGNWLLQINPPKP